MFVVKTRIRIIGYALVAILFSAVSFAHGRTLQDIKLSNELRICLAGSSKNFYRKNAEIFARYMGVQPKYVELPSWNSQFFDKNKKIDFEKKDEPQLFVDATCDLYPNDLQALSWRKELMLIVPYYRTQNVVISNQKIANQLNSEQNLSSRVAAVQEGTSYDKWIVERNKQQSSSNQIKIIHAPTEKSLEIVAKGEADFTILGAESSIKWIRSHPSDLELLFPIGESSEVGWGIPHGSGDLEFALAEFFKKNIKVGSELDNSWLENYGISLTEFNFFESSIDSAKKNQGFLRVVGLTAGGLLLGLFIGTLLWVMRLRSEIKTRIRVENSLRKANERLEAATSAGIVGIWEWDIAKNKVIWDDVTCRLHGITADKFDETIESWIEIIDHEDKEIVRNQLQEALSSNNIFQSEFKVKWRDNIKHKIKTIAKIHFEKTEPARMIGVSYDLTDQMNIQDNLDRLAYYDAVTGLPNRRLLEDRLEKLVFTSSRYKRTFALMYLDLDGFKQVNDTFGHEVGDQLLIEVARIMKTIVRSADTVARIGGDEFIVLLSEIYSRQDAIDVAEKIGKAIGTPLQIGGKQVSVSASIGIAIYPDHKSTVFDLMRAADEAMYMAKSAGKNRWILYQ